jgi:hypothetical protein
MVVSRTELYPQPGNPIWGIPAENEEMEGDYAPLAYGGEIF